MERISHATDGRGRDRVPLTRVLYRGELVAIGAFRAPVDHPRFRNSGPIGRTVFVFPRTSVAIQHEGRPPFVADTRTVTYYNEGQHYTRRRVDPRGDACEWFAVRPDVLRDVLARYDPTTVDRGGRIFPFTHGPSDRRAYTLQRLVVRHVAESEAVDGLLVEEVAVDVLARIAALAYGQTDRRAAVSEADGSGGGSAGLARRLRRYLLERYTASLSLDQIADAVGASVFHLCRVFKREMGTTIHRYRSELRLRRSLEFVAESDDLTRVALQLGYSSHSHFTAAFRRAFATTPSQFRRKASSRRIREFRERLADG